MEGHEVKQTIQMNVAVEIRDGFWQTLIFSGEMIKKMNI